MKYKYEKFNINPKNHLAGDCVVRALAKSSGLSWDDVFDELYCIAKKQKRMLNEPNVYTKFLENHGYVQFKNVHPKKGESRTLVKQLIAKNPEDNWVITIANHVTTGINGVLYDTWDCGGRCVYKAWYLPK